MSDPARLIDPEKRGEDAEASLRPQTLDDFTGQAEARANLKIFIEAAKRRKEGHSDSGRLQELSRGWATRLWEPYTEADMKILADPDLTDIEKSFHLKRTYAAVQGARPRSATRVSRRAWSPWR